MTVDHHRLMLGLALLEAVGDEDGKAELLSGAGELTGVDALVFLHLAAGSFAAFAGAAADRMGLTATEVLRKATLTAAGG